MLEIIILSIKISKRWLENKMTDKTQKHYFQVADIGSWDLDEDRSIVPSIKSILSGEGIDCVVDGDEMNSAGFEVWTYKDRGIIEKALEENGVYLEQ